MAGTTLTGVSRVFPGGIVACDGLDLDVRDGELLVLVGPSGSGKTTILRLIAGLDRPTSGEISIGGCVVNGLPARRRNVAMVFQYHALYPHWTAYKNIAFGLRRKSAGDSAGNRGEVRQRVLETAQLLRIEGLLDRRPGELSGGEQQRVALARAIARRPSVFLFDEPFSSLDTPLRLEMRHVLKQLHQQLGITMIYVTHDQADALALADRLAVLNRGRIEQVGLPQEVYDQPANRFVASFVGCPAINFFECRRNEEQDLPTAWQLSMNGWQIDVDPQWWHAVDLIEPAVVGLRAEDIHLQSHEAPSVARAPAVPARVEIVERLGDSCVVSLAPPVGGGQSKKQASPESRGAVLLCKCQVRSGLAPGEQVIAWFDMRRAHWFDGVTGRNLRQPGAR
jgi:ABC-type sugar transport system ATPase subunit